MWGKAMLCAASCVLRHVCLKLCGVVLHYVMWGQFNIMCLKLCVVWWKFFIMLWNSCEVVYKTMVKVACWIFSIYLTYKLCAVKCVKVWQCLAEVKMWKYINIMSDNQYQINDSAILLKLWPRPLHQIGRLRSCCPSLGVGRPNQRSPISRSPSELGLGKETFLTPCCRELVCWVVRWEGKPKGELPHVTWQSLPALQAVLTSGRRSEVLLLPSGEQRVGLVGWPCQGLTGLPCLCWYACVETLSVRKWLWKSCSGGCHHSQNTEVVDHLSIKRKHIKVS